MLVFVAAALFEMLIPMSFEPVEIAHDVRVREQLWSLLRDSYFGFAKTEEAAFVVKKPNGEYGLVRWPDTAVPKESRWVGAFPEGTIAIAHTHPNDLPQPSRADVRTARLRKIPVYVITRLRITKTTGGKAVTVMTGDWRKAKGEG